MIRMIKQLESDLHNSLSSTPMHNNIINNFCKKLTLTWLGLGIFSSANAERLPNIILLMSDDQGWGQTGYYNHPVLKTPALDAMASNGLRMDRFYAAAPNCSPTRASVLTGRTNDRTGVYNHGYPLRLQEKTIAQALKRAGYCTAHFGKWHLSGFSGPGVPLLISDPRNPGNFGFDKWLSVSNFFDLDPLMSENGVFTQKYGGSSEIIVREAISFIDQKKDSGKPFFILIWFGSPHNPWSAKQKDIKAFGCLTENEQNYYGELSEMDRSIGVLRDRLHDIGIANNTLVWFNSDNGGISDFGPATVGNLRGWKNTLYEGGIRVPCIIEWPVKIKRGRISEYPSSTLDIFPTIADIAGIPDSAFVNPVDGISLKPLFHHDLKSRKTPIPFRHTNRGAIIDGRYKLVIPNIRFRNYELYDLDNDFQEKNNIAKTNPVLSEKMLDLYMKWNQSVDESVLGKDFKGGLMEPDPPSVPWYNFPGYQPFLNEWRSRKEFKDYFD